MPLVEDTYQPQHGWGRDDLNEVQNRVIEEDHQLSLPMLCGADDANSRQMIPEIEAAIRRRFKFDSGWNMLVAEEILYGKLFWLQQNIGNCFPAGTLVRLADGTQKPIERVTTADEVVTAEGRTGRVSQTMRRFTNEPLYAIRLWGHYGLTLTSEHPLLTDRGYVEAKDIKHGDRVAMPKYAAPVCSTIQTAEHIAAVPYIKRKQANGHRYRSVRKAGGGREKIAVQQLAPDMIVADEKFGRLIGLYLAEGSADYSKAIWSFSGEERETLAAETSQLIQDVFNVEPVIRNPRGKNVTLVVIHSTEFAAVLDGLCGKLAGGKRLHSDLMALPAACRKAMIEGWLAGNGHERDDVMQGTTVSKALAHDMFAMGVELGLQPSITRNVPKLSHGVKNRQVRFDVFFRTSPRNPNPKRKANKVPLQHAIENETHVFRAVRSVEQIAFSGDVYNFSVEGDESYVADGISVHNCVGASHAALVGSAIAHEVVVIGQAEDRLGFGQEGMPFIPYSYGVGRMAGGMLGRGDGSYCGAQIKGTMEHGFLPSNTEGLDQYYGSGSSGVPQGTASAGRLFGKSRREIEKWMPQARQFDLLEAPKPRNAEEAYELVADKQIGLQICSGVMPTFWKDDPVYGPLYRMGERASHSTQIVAAFEYKGQRFFTDRNQWGNYHKGSDVFGFDKTCLVFPFEEMEKWYRQGVEVLGIGEIQGRPVTIET